MVNVLPECPATQTRPELFGFFGVVSLNPENAIVLDMQANRTSAATVKGGGGADDFYLIIYLVCVCSTHILLLVIWFEIFELRASIL
jgi:hypothetical protein